MTAAKKIEDEKKVIEQIIAFKEQVSSSWLMMVW